MSNCSADQKDLDFTYASPFRQIADREKDTDGGPSSEMGRSSDLLIDRLSQYFTEHPTPDIPMLE
jgi:hypothetical protein